MLRINPITNKIELTQGDNAGFKVGVQYIDKEPYEIQKGDSFILTIRKNIDDAEPALTKAANKDIINFEPEDTKQLEAGLYVYDIQLTTASGNIFTIIPTSFFEILKEVSR